MVAATFGGSEVRPTLAEKNSKHRVVIVGGGAGGITVAAQLARKLGRGADIAIVEPSEWHYYQPWWTMTGGGLTPVEGSRRPMAKVMPSNVKWIQAAASGFDPAHNKVLLADGSTVGYDYLVVSTGLQIYWNDIKGLPESIGHDGVSTIYDYRYAARVFEDIKQVKAKGGGNVLFTQPKTGVKCGGAPQKIMWLADDWWREQGVRDSVNVVFCTGTPRIFAVPKYAKALEEMQKERNVTTALQYDLVAVDGNKKLATFELPDGTRVTKPYDMLHVTPRMGSPVFLKESPLAHKPSGFVDVDKYTLQHVHFPNVFAIGDCANLPTSKTAAAITTQAPVVVHNIQSVMQGKSLAAKYDGYTSCPIITRKGGLILAEFKYGGELKETFPSFLLDQGKEQMILYYLKKVIFPWAYWNLMLIGRWYGPRTVFEPAFPYGD